MAEIESRLHIVKKIVVRCSFDEVQAQRFADLIKRATSLKKILVKRYRVLNNSTICNAINEKKGLEYLACRADDESINKLVSNNNSIKTVYFWSGYNPAIGSAGIQSLKQLKALKSIHFRMPNNCFEEGIIEKITDDPLFPP